jgi:FKBP-type peptidyl-prolyl cis-trans isomerase FklB
MKQIMMALSLLAAMQVSAQKQPVAKPKPVAKPAAPVLKNLNDSAAYALGLSIGQSLQQQPKFSTLNVALVQRAIADVLQKKPTLCAPESVNEIMETYMNKDNAVKIKANKAAGAAFLANNAKRQGVITMPEGWQYEVIKKGTDTVKPSLASTIRCHYHGTLIDGTVFDSSVERGEPISFPLGNVIRGWQLALQQMTVGSKWKIYLPSELAYGDRAAGEKIGPGATLIFEVELLAIEN